MEKLWKWILILLNWHAACEASLEELFCWYTKSVERVGSEISVTRSLQQDGLPVQVRSRE